MPTRRPMRGLSTHEVRDIWRYAVDTDFHAIDPSIQAEKQIKGYGTEDRFLPFDHPIAKSWFDTSINADGTLLAIPDKNNIDIYNLDTGARTVLVGHISEVTTVGFSPTDPNLLVSRSEIELRPNEEHPEYNDIIIWNVKEQQTADQTRKVVQTDRAAKAWVVAVVTDLGSDLVLSMDEKHEMRRLLRMIITRNETRGRVSSSSRLDGRISTSFQSPLFSNNGEYLMYLPGSRPRSNGDDTWDLCIYHLSTQTTTTLSGHRDSIMWTGFSPKTNTLVASAGWDGFVRVHDISGKEVWKWDTGKQNWAAVFSPDEKYLASTDGAGIVRIWDLRTGEETAKFDNGPRWCRTIDWSPDGHHIVVGSEEYGRLRLFSFDDGKIEMAQERVLSTENSKLDSLDSNVQRMVGGFMGVHTAKFLPSPEGGELRTRLVSSVIVDEGFEVFDFDTGKGWRFVPPYNDDGSVAVCKAGDGQNAVLEHVWRKDKGEIGIIAPDGIRLWRLE